jgi:hypothetical protein
MAASSTLQSAVVEKVVIQLLEQLATTQQMAQPATRPPARNAGAASRRQLTSHVLETRNH